MVEWASRVVQSFAWATFGPRSAEQPRRSLVNSIIEMMYLMTSHQWHPHYHIKRFCCACLVLSFPSIHHQQHLNHSYQPHKSPNQYQPTPHNYSTCLPTSDPAAPTRLVTRYDRPTHKRHVLIQSTNTLQRTVSDAEIKAQQEANRFHEGKENSHKANDSSTL